MRLSESGHTLLLVLVCLFLFAAPVLTAQGPGGPVNRAGLVAVHATTPTELAVWDRTIDRMVRGRQLVVMSSFADPDIDGRRHESLVQYHEGLPVYGGGLSRQTAPGGITVSIIGTVYEDIVVDFGTRLSIPQIIPLLAEESGGRLADDAPQLVIFPMLGGEFRLAYRATMTDMKTYIVDAGSGDVLWTTEELLTQSQVGVGSGVHGDQKKMSTTQSAGGFHTHDQLRPAPIRTFDTRGSEVNLNRLLLPPGAAVAADFSFDTDNTWADPSVVDTHVHTGWTEDFLFKQFNWTGVDNRGGTITSAVHSGLVNNAFFATPPFGADGRGMFVYGRTTTGVPLTTLDIVAHEMMHGVTHAALIQRTGSGLLNVLFADRLGPTSFTSGGASFPCDTTDAVFADGRRLPLVCSGGRYVLVSSHGGAINEAFSDVAGIGAEFFHHPPGVGPLRADYKMGEDVTGFGPNRAADAPASLTALPSSMGAMAYPDHASQIFSFLMAAAQGTRTNPTAVIVLPWTIIGDQFVTLASADGGGVHVNSTVLSHAFYLAIEGGRNATSGITVQGVGAANRAQIERAYFRAMTVLMGNIPTMQASAQAIVQGAVDLYGSSSAAAVALRQAMVAVGLM